MTKRTKRRGYPYPLGTNAGAGALDLEKLGRSVDRDIKVIDTLWQSDLVRPSITLTGTDTGFTSGAAQQINLGTTEYSVGNPDFDVPAYWLISVNASMLPSGAINANTARSLICNIDERQTGGSVTVESYTCQDLQADTTVWLATEFVTLLNADRTFSLTVSHNNTSSAVDVTGRACFTQLLLA
jgi:hypothetical protein